MNLEPGCSRRLIKGLTVRMSGQTLASPGGRSREEPLPSAVGSPYVPTEAERRDFCTAVVRLNLKLSFILLRPGGRRPEWWPLAAML